MGSRLARVGSRERQLIWGMEDLKREEGGCLNRDGGKVELRRTEGNWR
jgi:hypothetical protein